MHAISLPGPEHTLEDAKENLAISFRLAGEKPYPVLADLRNGSQHNREAREFYSKRSRVLAAALLVDSPVSKMNGNFFVRINNGDFPTRLFTAEAAALAWLAEFVVKEPGDT